MRFSISIRDKRFWFLAASALFLLLGVVFALILINTQTKFEADENPVLFCVFAGIGLVLCLLAMWKDILCIPSLLAFACSAAALSVYLVGRTSYFAFFITNDVMGTGLSPFFVTAVVMFFLATVAAGGAVLSKKR